MASKMLTVAETATMIGLSKSRLYQSWRELGLQGYKIGSLLHFREDEIEQWINSRKVAA